jgi:hypothetical protein
LAVTALGVSVVLLIILDEGRVTAHGVEEVKTIHDPNTGKPLTQVEKVRIIGDEMAGAANERAGEYYVVVGLSHPKRPHHRCQ